MLPSKASWPERTAGCQVSYCILKSSAADFRMPACKRCGCSHEAAQNNIQPYIDYFFYDKVNGVPHWQEICKYTLQAQGLDVGLPRKPLGELDDANKKKIEKLLADME